MTNRYRCTRAVWTALTVFAGSERTLLAPNTGQCAKPMRCIQFSSFVQLDFLIFDFMSFLSAFLPFSPHRRLPIFVPIPFVEIRSLVFPAGVAMAPDGRMFQASRKGELYELKQALNGTTMKERKTALKRTVAAMTLGKDVSSLFTDVVKNTAGDISMKKLVYLYIINYARTKPDLAILIVNTFIKDAVDPNPLIRALAIRTMALIPLDKITEYLCDPLHRALKDQDPYVRKTAAVCVAKLYDTNPTLAVEEGFIQELQALLSDGNPMTVSNAVAALSEIAETARTPNLLSLTPTTVRHYLSAMSECTEWGQIFILDAISSYIPSTHDEADLMVERIVPRLQHANPAVVLSAVRIIINLMPRLDSDAKRNFLVKKMSAPLVTLLTAQPELQFVALRNISLLIRDYPALLLSDVRVCFASYADPLYVKTEKLNVLARLADPSNIKAVLAELMEYTGEVDATFARSSVDCISRIALRLPHYAGDCISLLSDLLKREVVHLTEQVAVALKDVLRAYPNQYDQIIAQLCEAAEQIDEPEAKAALVWIIGEHADRIPSVVQMLNVIAESMDEETIPVQLQILTACVKTYLLCGPEAQKVMDNVLTFATQESENIDVRDRGFIYLRLISGGFDSAQQVVLSNKQGVEDNRAELPIELQKELMRSLSSIAAIYHKPPKTFEGARKRAPVGQHIGDLMVEEDLLGLGSSGSDENVATGSGAPDTAKSEAKSVSKPMGESLLDDMLGGSGSVPLTLPAPPVTATDDILSSLGSQHDIVPSSSRQGRNRSHKMQLLSAQNGKGLSIKGCLSRDAGGSFLVELELFNASTTPMSNFAIQFDKNMFGLAPSGRLVNSPLAPSMGTELEVPLGLGGQANVSKGFAVQMAMKFSPGGVVYFSLDVADQIAEVFDLNNGRLPKNGYISQWRSIPDASEVKGTVTYSQQATNSVDWIVEKLTSAGIFVVARPKNVKPPVLYLSSVLVGPSKLVILGELRLPSTKSSSAGTIASRTTIPHTGNVAALVSFNDTCAKLLA